MTFDWWTIGLQAINVAVLVWLLHRFFWRPVAAIIVRRRDETQATLADAGQKLAKADAALAEVATTRAGFTAERENILAAARAEAEAAKVAILKAGTDEVAAMRATARDAMAAEAKSVEKSSADAATALGLSIARRLAARLEGPAVTEAFLGWLIAAIKAMPGPDRQALAADGAVLDLVGATDMDPKVQARVSAAIASALGGTPTLTFRTDPALIAGIELHSPHITLRNSWQADLAQIAAKLREEPKTEGPSDAT